MQQILNCDLIFIFLNGIKFFCYYHFRKKSLFTRNLLSNNKQEENFKIIKNNMLQSQINDNFIVFLIGERRGRGERGIHLF